MMTKEERLAAQTALINWFRSQEIEPSDAAYILAIVAGTIVAEIAGKDYSRMREGIEILNCALYKGALGHAKL